MTNKTPRHTPIVMTQAQMEDRARRVSLTEDAIRQRDEAIARNAAVQSDARRNAKKALAKGVAA